MELATKDEGARAGRPPRPAWTHDAAWGLSLACTGYDEDGWQLCRPSWRFTLAASAVATVYIFMGLLILGLSVRAHAESGWLVALRLLACVLMYLLPHSVVACNVHGFAIYGVTLPCTFKSLILPLGLRFGALRVHARAVGCRLSSAIAFPLAFNAVPFLLTAAMITVPLGGEREHLGLVPLYLLGAMMSRMAVGFNGVRRMLPPRPGGLPYFVAVAKMKIFAVIGFFSTCVFFGLASRLTGPWLHLLMPVALSSYECIVTLHIQSSFVRNFIMNRKAVTSYHDTDQVILPSLFVCLVHCNAEAARLVVLLTAAAQRNPLEFISASILVSLAVNVLFRTKWTIWLVRHIRHHLGYSQVWNSNLMSLPLTVRFQMGYPRFMAYAAVLLARLCLGTLQDVNPRVLLCAGLGLAAELLEDGAVLFARKCGLFADVPFKPRPKAELLELSVQSRVQQVYEVAAVSGQHRSCSCCSCCRGHGSQEISSVIPSTVNASSSEDEIQCRALALADVTRAWSFRYQPRELRELPLWAHLLPVYTAEMHLVLSLIMFDGGLLGLLGFCAEPGYSGVGRGLIWWPATNASEPCGGP